MVPIFLEEALQNDGSQRAPGAPTLRMIDFLRQKTGLLLKEQPLPWNRALAKSRNGEGIAWGVSVNLERMQYFRYSSPVTASKVWGVSHDSALAAITSANQLKGKIISVGRGVSHGLEFERARKTLFTVEEDPATLAIRFKKLIARRCDMMLWSSSRFQNAAQVDDYLHQSLIPDLHDADLANQRFHVTANPLFIDTIHFACAKNAWQAEMDKLDQVLQQVAKTGELTRILAG